MKIIISTVFVVLLVSIAQAGIFTTSPVSSTVWTAQSPQTITWINDNKDPPLAQLTNVKIELMTGQQQQVSLLTIGDGIQGTALKFDFQQGVPTNLGPSGQFYFLKFSNGASYTGFSARFTINGINGTLPNAPANNTTAGNNTTTSPYSGSGNSTSGSTGGSTSGSTGGSSGSSSANSTSTTSSTKPTATATSSNKPSSTNKTSGANSLGAVHVATFVIALVGLIISNWI